MDRDLTLYTHPRSRGRTVRWMLEEIGVPYRVEPLAFGTTMKSPEYLAVNPMGKVPALRHGNVAVTECAAICAYLADAFPQAQLAPPDPPSCSSRAEARDEVAISTTSGRRATMASMLGSSPPPTCGKRVTDSGQLE